MKQTVKQVEAVYSSQEYNLTSVALINPPSRFLVSDSVMPPLGIMYLSSYLKAHGINAEIFDSATNPTYGIVPYGLDIYAFTATTPNYPDALEIMKQIKPDNQKSTFVIGGAHASSFPEQCLKDGFDCVVIGEGEKALLKLCLEHEELKKKNSIIRGTIRAKQEEDISTFPFPDRSFKGFDNYSYYIDGKKATTMITSRGCPFSCHFCCNMWGNKVRLRSAINVINEVQEINKSQGINAIQFYDDTFTVSKFRLDSICKGLDVLDTKWRCFIHANTVDDTILKKMHDSGCYEVGIGVESGNKKILESVNKTIDLNKVIHICNKCHDIGMRIKTFLIVGLPGESVESINDTIKFLRLARPDDFDITIYTPFPNTYIWNNKEKFDIQFNNNNLDHSKLFYKGKSGQYTAQISTSHLSSGEIEAWQYEIDTYIRRGICK